MSTPESVLSTLLNARVLAAEARVHRLLGWRDESEVLLGEAEKAVRELAVVAYLRTPVERLPAPPLLSGDDELTSAWDSAIFESGHAARRREHMARLPSTAELLAMLREAPQTIDQHRLSLDAADGVIWLTNPYGIDCACIEPTEEALQGFISRIRAGAVYGPIPE